MKKIYAFFSKRLFILAVVSLIVLTLSQVFGRYVWQLELFSHFVPYYAVVLLSAGFIFPKKNDENSGNNPFLQKVVQGVFLFVGVALVLWCLPSYQTLAKWYQIPKGIENPTAKKEVIAYQNVNISNQNKTNTLDELTKHDPDNLILLEAGGGWSKVLAPLKDQYPVHCGNGQSSPFSMQVFSQDEMATCELMMVTELPMIKLTLSDKQIIYAIHPPPPINNALASTRLRYLQQIHDFILQEDPTTQIMVIGDMNATAFSPVYRDFIKGTGLQKNMANGIPTWIPFAIGIDHVLTHKVSDDLTIKTLGWNGSDHQSFEISW